MFDTSLVKDLTEMLGKSLTFKDVDAIGGYIFKDHAFSTHAIAGVDRGVSISPLNAAKTLVQECERKKRILELFTFAFEQIADCHSSACFCQGQSGLPSQASRPTCHNSHSLGQIKKLHHTHGSLLVTVLC